MKILYLVNQYPKISHSFIRREIRALEELDLQILRVSVRKPEEIIVDPEDQQEFEATKVILQAKKLIFILSSLLILTDPVRFWEALKLTLKMGWKSERGLLRHLAYLVEASLLKLWCQKEQVTHIHAHFGTNSTTVALLTHKLGGPPYSFTVHGPEEFDKVSDIALPRKIKEASFVVGISSYGRSQLYRWSDLEDWSKIEVVHCGVERKFLDTLLKPIPEQPRLVCIGRLAPQKGQLLLIEAVNQLHLLGVECRMTLVGDGPMRSQIENFITKHHLEEQIKITGWASESQVQEYILESRALILPSFAEGLPVVLMEALALRRPVISTYIAGIPELVRPGVSGWLIPAGSLKDLVEVMQKVLQMSTKELEKMGESGYQDVLKEHDVRREAEKLAQLFHKQTTKVKIETSNREGNNP